jgi:very-short-patch-repair endonuclease
VFGVSVTALSPREREGGAPRRKGEGDRMRTYRNQPSGTLTRARTLRRDATDAEKALWRALRTAFPDTKFRRQVPIGPYFADFFSFSAKLIIEADGGQHDDNRAYDATRTRALEAAGYQVIRFWNHDILQNMEGVLTVIAQHLNTNPSPHGRGKEAQSAGRVRATAPDARNTSPSPSHTASPRGPLPLPVGEGMTSE